ncbi:MAG: hypothetical protein IT431_00370 [Phycisphaerales bacterium]|nr:hypothetical protein [Phycisphaerales bacterium]
MSRAAVLSLGVVVGAAVSAVSAQTIDPYYECAYAISNLGTPADIPAPLGGLVFLDGDPDTLLIGGSANNPNAAIYAVPVVRDGEGHITGFAGPGVYHADAPNIDGGLCYGPDGVLFFSRYNMNHVGQLKPGSTTPDKDIDLNALGFSGSVGAFMLVPSGFAGAGRFKIFPYSSGIWHDSTLTPDGNGTFDISGPLTNINLGGGPEGIVYVEAGASLFPVESVLISEYVNGMISSYEVDGNGDPIAGTRRQFMTGLSGAEGGTRDPVTGDFLFSTFGGANRVLVVTGFDPNCAGNYNADCAVNTIDVLDFLNDWAAGDPKADINGDGAVNTLDVLAFLNAWAGC